MVFRKHIRENEDEKQVWRVIGPPEKFSDTELRELVKKLLKSIFQRRMPKGLKVRVRL